MSGKLLRQIDNLSDLKKKNIDLSNPQIGMNGASMIEAVPKLDRVDSSVVVKNDHNSFIILGKDRPSAPSSGYGGAGSTQCGSIDLLVGMQSMAPGGPRNNTLASPSMMMDSARILISQMTDVDQNFGIVDGRVGSLKGGSAAVIKADSTRIIAREGGIKLVTGTDPKNSKGAPLYSISGIELIAGNDDKKRGIKGSKEINNLQPLVKGENLELYLDKVMNRIDSLASILADFMKTQSQLNTLLSAHVHVTAVGPTSPSIELMVGTPLLGAVKSAFVSIPNYINRVNIQTGKINYGKKYGATLLNSRYNRTT